MSLLDDALKAATSMATGVPIGVPTGPMSTAPVTGSALEAGIDLTGAHVTLDSRIAKNWSSHLWADAEWSGDHSAGFSIKGTF